MSGIDVITQKIREESAQQAQKILKKAREEAEATLASARKEAAQKHAEIMKAAEKEAEELEKRLYSMADLEFRKDRLAVKQQLISQVFGKTIDRIKNLPADEYFNLLFNMITAVVKTGNEKIILSAKDQGRMPASFLQKINTELVSKGLQGNIAMADENRDIQAGFILVSGAVEINHSLEFLLRMQQEELETDVAALLFQ